jgi:thymidylate synthase
MREVVGYSFSLMGDRTFLCNERRALSPTYAAAETLWYLGRGGSVEMMKAYAAQYVNYTESDGTVYGAYGARIARNLYETTDGVVEDDLLDLAVEQLRHRPDTRQCVVSLWRPDDISVVAKDRPCTLSWQFLRRDGYLHMVVNMRSNDAWLGLPYDVFAFTCVQRLVADTLRLDVGKYVHNVGSMHLYEKHVPQARQALDYEHAGRQHLWQIPSRMEEVPQAIEAESKVRHTGCERALFTGDMLRDLYYCCADKWVSGLRQYLQSPALRHMMEVHDARNRGRRPSGEDDAGKEAGSTTG